MVAAQKSDGNGGRKIVLVMWFSPLDTTPN
jgi:hypothetical protein